jgi:hypothetical protein
LLIESEWYITDATYLHIKNSQAVGEHD